MAHQLIGQTLRSVTKILLATASSLQPILDSPGETHYRCLEKSYELLSLDGNEEISRLFSPYHRWLKKGLLWADQGWKNAGHFYCRPDHQESLWPNAAAECQLYFNKAVDLYACNKAKSMFYLGAALHIVQDMCVPHHAVGAVFDGHREFEKWAGNNWQHYAPRTGSYLPFTHPAQWIAHNARLSAPLYTLVSLEAGADEVSFAAAAAVLIPLTVATTAGFLEFSSKILLSSAQS